MPIPRIIHQFWVGPKGDKIPADIEKNIQSWEETHPDFIRITWSLQRLSKLLQDFHGLNVLKCIQACRFPAMQSDLVRLALIYEHGGFWSDLKNKALQPFLYDLIEYDIPILAQHWPVEKKISFDPHLLNSFMGAPKHNGYIWMCLEQSCQNIINPAQ